MKQTLFYSFLICFLVAAELFALPPQKWEVAALFLAANEDAGYQGDIDKNILELASVPAGRTLSLSIYRELPAHNVEYHVIPASAELHPWQSLFHVPPKEKVLVPGKMVVTKRASKDRPMVTDPLKLKAFLGNIFQDPKAKRMLIIYSHGEAFEGLGDHVSLLELKSNLEATIPKRTAKAVDILWFDACFMANLEAIYEVRSLSDFVIGSEEAEFASGAPFDMLAILGKGSSESSRNISQRFAERFIESYSYQLEGEQRHSVFESAATISVIETSRLEPLVQGTARLSHAIGSLTSKQRDYVRHELPELSMKRNDLVDFGALLLGFVRSPAFREAAIDAAIGDLRALVGLNKSLLNQSPRVKISPTNPKTARMVFGYNDWTKGFEKDEESWDRIPEVLKAKVEFVTGENGKKWPSIAINRSFFLSPFSVDMGKFHYYFIDAAGKKISRTFGYIRTQDFVYSPAPASSRTPIIWNGFTYGKGDVANRYTGLSILNPANGISARSYLELEFSKLTGWGNL